MMNIHEEQLDQLLSIWLASNVEAHAFIDAQYWHQNVPFVREMFPQTEIYSYFDKGRIIGFIGLSNDYIAGLFVDKNYRGRGIGTQLLSSVKQNKQRLDLTVYEKNSQAVRFYLSQNFTIQKKQTDENTKENELFMSWRQS